MAKKKEKMQIYTDSELQMMSKNQLIDWVQYLQVAYLELTEKEQYLTFYKKMIALALQYTKQECYELIGRMLSGLAKIPAERVQLPALLEIMLETYYKRVNFAQMLKDFINFLALNDK
jgi:hypothetical protein